MKKAELPKSFTLNCARCGGKAAAYAYPMPRGSVFCPNCSPPWLESFLKFAVERSSPG